jgi:ribonuclease HII
MVSIMLVCGIDEAGRGPLAGPVTAAAVILPEDFPTDCLNDSKRLSARQREQAAALIRRQALAWATGWAWPEEIDRLNIHRATLSAMRRALFGLQLTPQLVLVDGAYTPQTGPPCRACVQGDRRIPAIMAASIIAKTERDRWMIRYARIEPQYGFELHKGYPTRMHRERIRLYGPSAIQRKSFSFSFS